MSWRAGRGFVVREVLAGRVTHNFGFHPMAFCQPMSESVAVDLTNQTKIILMKKFIIPCLAAVALLSLVGCDTDKGSTSTTTTTQQTSSPVTTTTTVTTNTP